MDKKVVVGFLLLLVVGLLWWRPWAPRPTTMPQPPVPTATQPPTATPDLEQLIESAVQKALAQSVTTATPLPPTAQPTNTASAPTAVLAGPSLPRVGDLFQTPVKCTGKFNDQSSWLICEPGVLLDNTTAWTIPATEDEYFFNVPEGGFWYGSMGQGVITVDNVVIELPPNQGLNYLVLIRGRIDDGIADSDLNLTAKLSSFKPGHAIYAHMPTGAYVSRDWFRQQLVASSTGGFTNCGATGCSRVQVVLFDVASHVYQMFEVKASDLDNWILVEHN
jgi:hypothetical protein